MVRSHDRGFFGKLKDKAIGTKEEREAKRRQEIREEEEVRVPFIAIVGVADRTKFSTRSRWPSSVAAFSNSALSSACLRPLVGQAAMASG